MAKGGARANSGPPPDPMALRRNRKDDAGWETLPAEGRDGAAPEWPLAPPTHIVKVGEGDDQHYETVVLDEVQARELVIWAQEWKRPQAVMWERHGQELEVALYVRSLVDAENHLATTASRTLVRQQQEALGISLPGLARNRWRITDQPAVSPRATAARERAKSRFKVIDGSAA